MIPFARTGLIGLVNIVFWGLQALVVIHALASWIPAWQWRRPGWMRPIDAIVEPMLRPIQRLLSRHSQGIDFSPLLLIIALQVVHRVILSLLARTA